MTTNGDAPLKVVPVRHVGRWFSGGVALLLIAMLVHTIFSKLPTGQFSCSGAKPNRICHVKSEWRFSWDVIRHYFFTSEILHGVVLTLLLTVLAMAIGIVIGLVIAIMRLSPSRLLSSTAWTYTWFFRGTPVYVQLLLWFNISAIYPQISLGVPFTSITFWHISAVSLFDPFRAALVGLALNEGAYMSEIARAGIISVDEGQIEAASAIGLTRRQTLGLVVVPQAMRVIIPPTGNEIISMLKTSSLASIIGVTETLGAATNIYSANYEVIPLLLTASLWYLLWTTVLSSGQFYVERYFGRGSLRTPPPTPLQRLRRDARGIASKFRTPRGLEVAR
ncbi:MAG TPA: amino acid ABC transporter permease [Acidimicrobiales bacterium]|nr:amino acid ABC transporter permease [Acidimicrobiales bacterium]